MKTYIIPCDWQVRLPDNWVAEYYKSDNQSVFYPDDSELTIRMTPFQLDKDGVPLAASDMEALFLSTTMSDSREIVIQHSVPVGFKSRVFRERFEEDGRTITEIYVGIFAEGELLLVNIFGTSDAECMQGLAVLDTLQKAVY